MMLLAGTEIVIVFAGIVLFIWRLQFVFPDFALLLLAFLVLTFFVHRDGFKKLGFGSHGLLSATKSLIVPTAIISIILVLAGAAIGNLGGWTPDWREVSGFSRYFAWCLFQQFGLQSFFTNRLFDTLRDSKRTAWVSGMIFAAFHIPNPVLMPLTFAGAVILTRVFIRHRNLVLRLINSFTIVASAMAPDSRSDEGAMLIHCDRGATTKTGPFRRNPSGRWGLRAISSSRFVGDERASPSSSLLDLASQSPIGDGKAIYETQH